ncbi:hypothetical protein PInf_025727 [Phytophthora infestans]|nr:hypothetical protein PInf_025727 [Phytophthora infestans]
MLGLGVYKAAAGEEAYESVLSALRLGYRHIDTARLYENEADVGRAIFITSKLREFHWGYDKALEGARSSNDLIGCSYIDLFLLHQPFDPKLRADTWRALEDLQKEGVLRDIGVSNFGEAHLAKLAETRKVKPAVNQIELHPWLTRQSLVNYCEENGIHVQAFSPLARVKKMTTRDLMNFPRKIHHFTQVGARSETAGEPGAANVKLTPEQVTRLDAFNEDFYSGTDHVSNSAV